MNAKGNETSWLQIGALSILTLALLWLVLTKSVVAYLAKTSPAIALAIEPGDALALSQLADTEMKQRQRVNSNKSDNETSNIEPAHSARTDAQVRSWAEESLRQEPLNARALRILGQLTEYAKDDKKRQTSEQLMKTALRLSKRESIAVYWLIRTSYARKDHQTAISNIDILLRSHPSLTEYTMPLLVRIFQPPEGQALIEKVFASNPPWRWRFFRELRKTPISDARMPLLLLLNLQKTAAPPTIREIRFYLTFLHRRKLYQLAYYSWLQFLSREQLESVGPLFDGSFNYEPNGLPFAWRLPQKSKADIKITGRPNEPDNPALSIEFGYGNDSYGKVEQMTVLDPGRYLFKGSYMGTVKGRRGLLWRIVCVGGNKWVKNIDGPTFKGRALKWKSFEFAFKIPDVNCPAQRVQLIHDARTKSEQLISGRVWYDDLQIMRAR